MPWGPLHCALSPTEKDLSRSLRMWICILLCRLQYCTIVTVKSNNGIVTAKRQNRPTFIILKVTCGLKRPTSSWSFKVLHDWSRDNRNMKLAVVQGLFRARHDKAETERSKGNILLLSVALTSHAPVSQSHRSRSRYLTWWRQDWRWPCGRSWPCLPEAGSPPW